MEHDYSHPCLIKATSPMKPRYLNGGDERHDSREMQTIVSAMCKNLLEGDSRVQEVPRRHNRAPTSPTELPYDRGLQRDGGYTMYTPEFNFQDDNISHFNTSYNKAAATIPQDYARMTVERDRRECLPVAAERPTKARYHSVYGDNQEVIHEKKSRQHIFVQGYHPYVTDGKGTPRFEHEGKAFRNSAAPGKCTKRSKRTDKKAPSRKQSSRREQAQKIQSEKDIAAEWTNLIHSTIIKSAKKPEADWELMNSTTPPMAKGHRQWCQEILGQRNRSERKRNRNQEVNVPCSNTGHSDCCLDWKKCDSSRNRFSNECSNDGHHKEETSNNSFLDASCHRNSTKITFSSACDEQSRNCSRVSNRTAGNPDCRASRQALLDACSVRETGDTCRNATKYSNRSNYGDANRDDTLSYRIINRNIPEEVARAPWKCTVWENQAPLSTPQPIAWSCEMYSHTCLTEPDVGMASTDQYKSYINARSQMRTGERATKDFACQESLPHDIVQKAVHSAITQTDELLVSNATGMHHVDARDVKLAMQERGHCNLKDSVDKKDESKSNDPVNCKPPTPLSEGSSHKKEVGKSQEYAIKPIRIQSNNVSPKSPINFIMNGKVLNNALISELNEHLILTSMVPSENSSSMEATNLKKLTSDKETSKKALIRNILVVPESKLAAIPTLVGNSVSHSEQSTGPDSKEINYWKILPKTNSHQTSVEEVEAIDEQVKCRVDDSRCGDSRLDVDGKMSASVDDTIPQSHESNTPFQYYVEEQRITQCSGKVGVNGKSISGRRGTSTKRSNEMLAGLEKTIRAYEKVTAANDMKEYERYKMGRKKYEEELALKGCEFEIEELKFQKQVSYEPLEDQAIEERFQRNIGNSKQLSEVNKLGRLNETVKLLDSSGSRMDSPLSISLPSDEDVKTDACFSYQEECYKKNAAPPGDPSDITPCFTCNSSSSRSASSISKSPRKQRKKTTNTKRKDEALRKKSHKTSRKRSSSLSQSSRESSSTGKEFKKSKRSLKRQKSLPRRKDTVVKKYNGKPPSPAEKESKRKSNSRSSSSLSNFSHKSVRAKDKDEITHNTVRSVDTDESRVISNIASTQNGGTPRTSMLRRQVKKHYQVAAPELLSHGDLVCHNNPRVIAQNIPSTTNSAGCDFTQDVLSLKHILKQREANFSKSDPFGSVNTEELNLSILKLYREIHKLQKQLESNRDDSELQFRQEKSGKYSPLSESTDKTLPFSSSCKSHPDNTECHSLNTTLKENSVNTSSSSEWIRSKHTQEEKPLKLCQLSKGSHSKYCSGDFEENSATTIICRTDSPQKMAKKKMIPSDASLSRVARPIYRKLAAPCLKCWRQSNTTRATRKQNAPSPNSGPTDPGCCWGTDDDEKVDDEDDAAVNTSVSKIADSCNAIVHNVPLPTGSLTKYPQTAENTSNKLNVEMCQKRFKDTSLKIDDSVYQPLQCKPNNQKRENNSGQMDFRCFRDDLHLLLTSAPHPDRDQFAVEKRYSDVYGQSSPGNEETRSARSYVCSSSWISSPSQRADTRMSTGLPPDETGYLDRAVSSSKPDENSGTQVAESRNAEEKSMDGNNSKLDENEQLSERILRLEKKLPTSVTCRKLKIFGATSEQTLQFYNSAVLEGCSIQSRRIRSPEASRQQETNLPDANSDVTHAVNNTSPSEAPVSSLRVEPAMTVSKDEHRGEYRVISPCRQAEQKWQPAIRPKIPYSMPHRKNLASSPTAKAHTFYDGTVLARVSERAGASQKAGASQNAGALQKTGASPPKDNERKFDERLSRENSFDIGMSERQAEKNTQRRFSGDSASPRTHSAGRHYSKPITRRVKHESPIEKIIELLTDKSSSQVNERCNPMYGVSSNYEDEYKEKFTFRKSSPDSSRRKVFEPNKTYSEFERSPPSEFNSPNSFSTFFHQNVQQITDYIQSFKNYNHIEKNLVDKVGPCSHMSSRETKPQYRRRFDPGTSSNNIYGQCPSSTRFENDNLDKRIEAMQFKNYDNRLPELNVISTKDKSALSCKPDNRTPIFIHHDPRLRQGPQVPRQTYIMASSRRRRQDCIAPNVRADARNLPRYQSRDMGVDNMQSPPMEGMQSHKDYSPVNQAPSTRLQSHSSRSSPGSIDSLDRERVYCEGRLQNTHTLSNKPSNTDEFLNSFTVNNNSNQGDPYRGNENIYVEPANPDMRSHCGGGVNVNFGPKNLSYTACQKPKCLNTPQQLKEPPPYNEMNIGSLGALRTLNLVGCVKEMFFKSFKADLNMVHNETGDHACPPKSSARLKLIPSTIIGDSSVDVMDGKNKKMEETILCEYIAGRKQRISGDENLPMNKNVVMSPQHVTPCNRSHYINKQRSDAENENLSGSKCNERSNMAKEIDNIPLNKKCVRIGPVKTNKNSFISCDRVKVCSLEKGGNMLHNMAAKYEWVGGKSSINRATVTRTEDSSKAIAHYSDAIRTGSRRVVDSVRPLNEAFTDFCSSGDESRKYRPVKDNCPRGFQDHEQFQNNAGDSLAKMPDVKSPRKHSLGTESNYEKSHIGNAHQESESSIMSSFEKMMQDKRPCYAEECQLRTRDNTIKDARRHYCNPQAAHQHFTVHSTQDTDGNNSSNENGDVPPSTRQYSLAPQCLSIQCDNLESDGNCQHDANQNVQCKQMVYVKNHGGRSLNLPDTPETSRAEQRDLVGDFEETQLDISIDSPDLKNGKCMPHYILENCSEIMVTESPEKINLLEDCLHGDGATGNQLNKARCPENDTVNFIVDEALANVSLDVTQDVEGYEDDNRSTGSAHRDNKGNESDDGREKDDTNDEHRTDVHVSIDSGDDRKEEIDHQDEKDDGEEQDEEASEDDLRSEISKVSFDSSGVSGVNNQCQSSCDVEESSCDSGDSCDSLCCSDSDGDNDGEVSPSGGEE